MLHGHLAKGGRICFERNMTQRRGRAPEAPVMIELPSANTRRWVARRKAAVVAAVSSGMITLEEACRRYHMSEEELLAWQCAFENHGILGLRAGRLQQQRGAGRSRPDDPAPSDTTQAQHEDTSAKV
jgi:transposase-like protein